MAQMNQRLSGIDTFFISTSPQHSFLSSSLVREVAKFGGDVSSMVPPIVAKRLTERFGEPEEPVDDRRRAARADPPTPRPPTPRSAPPGPRPPRDGAGRCRCRRRVMVNRDELLVLLEDAVAGLPEELRQARWLLKEREEFLAKARREAEDIIDAGRAAGRAHGRADRGRAGGPPPGPAGRRRRRGRGPGAQARGRGLHRPEARVLRGRARADDAGGPEGPRAAPGRRRPPRAPRWSTEDATRARSSTRTRSEKERSAAVTSHGRCGVGRSSLRSGFDRRGAAMSDRPRDENQILGNAADLLRWPVSGTSRDPASRRGHSSPVRPISFLRCRPRR